VKNGRNGVERGLWALGGIGLGAGLMYLLDPDRGKRRRALIRDKCVHAVNSTGDAVGALGGRVRDLGNRSIGVLADARSWITGLNNVDDETLVARIRSRLGHVTNRGGRIDVTADHGQVTLSGATSADKLSDILVRVSTVPGVRGVESRLKLE
jgi:osmotically-inducible protein OsmY